MNIDPSIRKLLDNETTITKLRSALCSRLLTAGLGFVELLCYPLWLR